MLKKIREMKTKNERETTLKACTAVAKKYKGKVAKLTYNNNNYIMVEAKEFTLLVTVCKTNNKFCVKLEEILVEEAYRSKGIGTDVINIMKRVCEENSCTLGLWCRLEDNRTFDYYTRLGFKHTETLNDKWMEWN
ncbi:MAG: GNAT family N-acetyltransferase [Cetobacterium sp.]